ncbi:MAG TPA: glycosyl transferase family 36, partial [Gemmataceae bacterium]|nr:glycosyl transferase family 36 [Gemmataceae bacterium]
MTAHAVEASSSPPETPTTAPAPLLFSIARSAQEPIRAELYGLESLRACARSLAASLGGAPEYRSEGPLFARLRQNHQILVRYHRRCTQAAAQGEPLTPDAEWLLDNFYLVDGVLRAVRHDLPRGYYRELPKLAAGQLAGYPRIFALALALIAHTDSALDENHIACFVQAYQAVAPLTIGELWAVPTMLRLGLIENLRRLAEQASDAADLRRRAAEWVAPLREAGSAGRPLPSVLALAMRLEDWSRATADPFAVHCLDLLRSAGLTEAVDHVQTHLNTLGVDVGEAVRRENQRQAVNQVSVGNCITSLRVLGALDWGRFFEGASFVEAALREDPAGVYLNQDFATRDRYRQVVERLARRSSCSELETARWAVRLAAAASDEPRNHVGYYLVGPGLAPLRAKLHYRPRWRDRLLDAVLNRPYAAYFGPIGALTVVGLCVVAAASAGVSWPATALLVLAALLPVSGLAVGLVNFFATLLLPPRVLPKLELREGIPADCAGVVVVPTLLSSPEAAAALVEKLEIHYLANADLHLRFALLTDFSDAPAETMPNDEACLRPALDGVRALNQRYAAEGPPRFYLLHRRRLWNPEQGCWMGWERKRGKLSEFNRLLRGATNTTYTVFSSDISEMPYIRYVVTLDVDTQLPRETARRLIGAMAHPLNRPRLDPTTSRVIDGYGVLQPRIGLHIPAARRSRFTRIWGASAGVDPYSTAVSDLYQDLFGAGSFTGKGVYDLDAFEAATGRTFPDNHILSHDLIEGNYARCGLATDVEWFDDIPVRYNAFARRQHRWIRGDWQLAPWLGRTVPVPALAARPGERA